MNKHVASVLACASLLCLAGAASADASSADMGLDTNKLYFRYATASLDSGDIQMLPNTEHNPLVLPCEMTRFGGQLDITNAAGGSAAYPKVGIAFYDGETNALITSAGYSGTASLGQLYMSLPSVASGARGQAGYTPVDTVDLFRDWQFQTADFEEGQLVRMHLTVAPTSDAGGNVAMSDPNPSNDAVDIWVTRTCACH